jgi:hypothetical protein
MYKKCLYYLGACLIVALALMGCQIPSEPASGSTSPTTGSISGLAVYKGQSNDSGIVISVDSVNGSGQSLSIRRSITTRSLVSRAIVAQATTDPSGAYTLTDLAPGTYTVYASSPNSLEQAVSTGVSVTAGKEVTASELDLTATGAISGTATLGGATAGNLGILVYIAGTSYCALTRDDGTFTISGVPVGTGYLLVASYQGYGTSSPETVSVASAATTAAPSISLTPFVAPATTGTVTGTATMAGQAADANAGIFIYLTGTSYLTMTNSSGAYALSGVAPGTYTLVASFPNYGNATTTVNVTAGNSTTAAALSLTATLSLNVSRQFLIVGANPYQLVATVVPSNAAVAWTSSNPTVASVSNTGLVTQLTSGTTTITATSGSNNAACAITSAVMFSPGTLQVSATNSGLTVPVYWKNGVATLLSTGAQPYGSAEGYTIVGTTIYIAGYIFNSDQTIYTPVLWTNGQLSTLTLPTGITANLPNWIQASSDPSGNIYIRG